MMSVSEATYRSLALEDPDGRWELVGGCLRGKPAMSWEHTDVMSYLGYRLAGQLDRRQYRVHIDLSRLRVSARNYLMPDVCVIPSPLFQRRRKAAPGQLEYFDEALPLVVEVWSPSTGDYDVDEKIPAYQRRGDLEIWRLHPFERTLTAWRRQPDGGYVVTVSHGGMARPVALPGVAIDLDELFDLD
jgi:Uma2 family endonuclease